MHNTLTAAELKRRGMAAIEEGLRKGPAHIFKRNGPAAVLLTKGAFQRLSAGTQAPQLPGLSAMQWLLQHPPPAGATARTSTPSSRPSAHGDPQRQTGPVYVFLDASALIYLVEARPPFAEGVRAALLASPRKKSIQTLESTRITCPASWRRDRLPRRARRADFETR